MTKKLLEIAAEIVQGQVGKTPMTSAEIASSLRLVFETLHEIQKSEVAGTPLATQKTPKEAQQDALKAMSPQDSIREDKVICLECGAEMKQLTARHLASHSLTPREYKTKFGFSMKTPLAAKSLTKARSKAAKTRGLPEKLMQFLDAKRQKKAENSITIDESLLDETETGPMI